MADTQPEHRNGLSPLLWIIIALFALFLCFPTLFRLSEAWPPAFLERRTQREQVLERVQSSGGWLTLQHDCAMLVEQYKATNFIWFRVRTNYNELPAAIAALKPREVRFYGVEPPVVHIKVFGFRSTDGHQPPYFGLEVVSGSGADSYKPKDMRYELVTNNIYEVYH